MTRGVVTLLLAFAAPAFGWTVIAPQIDGWAADPLPVYVNPTGCTIPEAELYDEVDRAIAIWNAVPTSRLTMVRSPLVSTTTHTEFQADTATDMPVIFCDPNFGDSDHVGSADFVPAATLLRNISVGPLVNAAIYLNVQPGAGAEISQMDIEELRITLTHEMGHMLGLGHSDASTSLMYFSLSGKSTARITEDDRMGITFLYPRNEFSKGAFGCAAVPGSGTPWGMAAAFLYLAALVLAARLITSGRLRALREWRRIGTSKR